MQIDQCYERAEAAVYEAMEAAIADGVDPDSSRNVLLCYLQHLEGIIRDLVRVGRACSTCGSQCARKLTLS